MCISVICIKHVFLKLYKNKIYDIRLRLRLALQTKTVTIRATIDLEPKIRTAEESFILLPKKITIVSVCTTNVRSYVSLFISRNHLLQQCRILDFL